MLELVTSYGDTTAMSTLNQVALSYNAFAQLTADAQNQTNSGGPNLTVNYDYADGFANTIRRTSTTYPYSTGGRSLGFVYDSGDDDALSRVSSLAFGGGTVAGYGYFGLGSIASTAYADGAINTVLADSTPSYPGFDQFGRLINVPWTKTTTGDLAQLEYGYNRASSRTYRRDVLAHSGGKSFDEIYQYDGVQRLVNAARGLLSEDNTRLTAGTFGQTWNLDATGNWSAFNQFDAQTGTFSALDQQRTSNAANEITAIGATVGDVWQTPAYDRNGNMTMVPKPADIPPATREFGTPGTA